MRLPDSAVPQQRLLLLTGRHLPEEKTSSTPAAEPDKAAAPASAKAVALPGVHGMHHEKSLQLMNVAVIVAAALVAADVAAPDGAAAAGQPKLLFRRLVERARSWQP
jgi:hypothetical protein